MSRRNSKTKRRHRTDPKKIDKGINFNIRRHTDKPYELATDRQVSLLVALGFERTRAQTMFRRDAAREIDRLKPKRQRPKRLIKDERKATRDDSL